MRTLITGINGQDGYFMVQKNLQQGNTVLGLTSNIEVANKEYGDLIGEKLEIANFDYLKKAAIENVIDEFKPDYIFNLAAKATGQGMFDIPDLICRLNGEFVVDILDSLRLSDRKAEISFCQASSSEMFGSATESPQTEDTLFNPMSPYGAAKLYAHNLVKIYRSMYGVKCCAAVLYNHESTRRSVQFVTKKIAHTAVQIKLGKTDSLILGDLGAKRDWGYAPEYVDAMFKMAVNDAAEDYIVATGTLSTVKSLCEAAFGHLDLDFTDFVQSHEDQLRKVNTKNVLGNPERIRKDLGWAAKKGIKAIMIELVEHELKIAQG